MVSYGLVDKEYYAKLQTEPDVDPNKRSPVLHDAQEEFINVTPLKLTYCLKLVTRSGAENAKIS